MGKICFFSIATILALFLGSENLIACHEEASGGDGGIWPTLDTAQHHVKVVFW